MPIQKKKANIYMDWGMRLKSAILFWKEITGMTKEVLVKISGLQFTEENDNNTVELITTGNYYKKNGKHYILYDEVQEGFDGVTKNLIKVKEDSLDVTKKGVTNVHMMFEKNKKNLSYYDTPYGSLLVGIDATDVFIKETQDSIDIKVDYRLELNYEYVAACSIKMNIMSKDVKDFSI